MRNMVDERFEICALLFRFISGAGFDETETDYQHKITNVFSAFANHPAVIYAKSLFIGYDAVAKYAVHIDKRDDGMFYLIDDLQSLTDCGRWDMIRANTFTGLLNDFAIDTQFEKFYESHTFYYEEETLKFVEQQYSKIDFEWFRKYLDISYMRCIFSPSLFSANYGVTARGKYVYSIVPHNAALVHEYCHSFANDIAEKWYKENARFKKLCDDTATLNTIPWYKKSITFAYEYVTRAYNILYDFQHGEKDLQMLYKRESDTGGIENGFPYLEQVYEMVLEYSSQPGKHA